MTSWLRYARHADVPALTASGLWRTVADLGPVHGFYAVLMVWIGPGEPSAPLPIAAE